MEDCASSSQLCPRGKKREGGRWGRRRSFSDGTFLIALERRKKKVWTTGHRTGDAHRCRHGGGMRTCARWWGRGAPPLRSGILLLLVPPLVFTLQLLVAGPRLPPASRAGVEERDAAVVFSVISIEPKKNSRKPAHRRPGPVEVRGSVGVEDPETRNDARTYEEENEVLMRQMGPRTLELMPWAADKHSFTAELNRIIMYIPRPQINCSRVLSPGRAQPSLPPADSPRWMLCAEDWLLPAADRPCVAYSFSMDGGDSEFLKTVSVLGCEVHTFDPSKSNVSSGHLGNSLASNHGDEGVVRQHKMWLEWRAPRKRKHKTRGNLGSVSQTLADIMAALGHHTVHFLYADLLSAEWRVFQNWIESGTLQSVHHLVAIMHLQWAGFEVGGTSEEVLRYWFSVLQGVQASGLMLVHSSPGEGHSVLKKRVANAHSSYTLSWVNMRH
ncbi:probable methyltransferase-like protein 24 [Antennarius striatus]|uniref:probable methyltransferase-like protein 24 n=1 Tax=Antennarius striatus TaxID=241820 RepID=UPI0035AEDB76